MEETAYLSRRHAAAHLGVSLSWLATQGRYLVPSYRVGGVVKYRRDELDAWVKQQRVTRP